MAPAVNHETLDELPKSRTRDYVRALLVEHGVLPHRDELSVRYQEWATQALARVITDQRRDTIRRYIRWHHQRRMNSMDAVSHGTFLRAKQTVTVAIDFLNWLTEHHIELSHLQQADLDTWQAEGPTTRELANRFLGWAIKSKLVNPDLAMTPHRRGTSAKLSAADQDGRPASRARHRAQHA